MKKGQRPSSHIRTSTRGKKFKVNPHVKKKTKRNMARWDSKKERKNISDEFNKRRDKVLSLKADSLESAETSGYKQALEDLNLLDTYTMKLKTYSNKSKRSMVGKIPANKEIEKQLTGIAFLKGEAGYNDTFKDLDKDDLTLLKDINEEESFSINPLKSQKRKIINKRLREI